MKKKCISKFASVALASCLALGGISFGSMKSVEADDLTLMVLASEFNDGTAEICDIENPDRFYVPQESGYTAVELILDEDIHLSSLECYGDLTVSGGYGLYMDEGSDADIFCHGNLTIEEETTLYTDTNSDICAYKYNNSLGDISIYGDVYINQLYEFKAEGDILFSGSNIDIEYCYYFINDSNKVTLENCSINALYVSDSFIDQMKDDITIDNTSIDIKRIDDDDFIVTDGNVNINDSDIFVNAVYDDFISVNGSVSISGSDIYLNFCDYSLISSEKDVTLDDSYIYGGYINYGIYSYGDLVSNSVIIINSYNYSLYSDGAISITDGSINVCSSNDNSVYADDGFSFTGGSFSARSSSSYYALKAGEPGITIGDNCYIYLPDGGVADSYQSGEATYYTIFDTDGNKATKVELCEYDDLADAEITGVEDKAYTGQPITQNLVVTLYGDTLEEGTDYNVTYSNNTEVGTATITITPAEGTYYQGQATVTFKITEAKKDDDKKDDDKKDGKKYKSEWVDGKWYDANGAQTYKYTGAWKSDAAGYWFEDSSGWYAKDEWVKIDGKWYFFCADGYMDYSEYRDGCWLGADGAWDEKYSGGHWMQDSKGWWYEDASGWYPQNEWVWIDGSCYYFGTDGYMATSTYIDGCWVDENGVWVK